ncbi:MAG: thermonuclease family protein [Alphaproteobacteria bacterium]|nr:thermonuclease family protein [Alphaproteobacteria bacterium]
MLRVAAVLLLVPTIALADITGPARDIDGDTIEVAGRRIRLHGIDAPESDQLCYADGRRWQCGEDAGGILANLIANRPVTCQERDRDRYGRIVATCSVAGGNLGEWMVLNGLAVAYVRFSYEYTRAEHYAKSSRRGIWT